MKLIVFLFFLIANVHVLANPVARFLYEDAEAALAKQDFLTALKKLEESERELGKLNPDILHLRIVSEHEYLKSLKTEYSFTLLSKLQNDCQLYMKQYASTETDVSRSKARDVYRVMESLKEYPLNITDHLKLLIKNHQYEQALSEVNDAEKIGPWSEELSYLKIDLLHHLVQNPHEHKERARMLSEEVKQWMEITENGSKATPEKLQFVRSAEAKVVELEEYFIAWEAYDNKDYEKAKPMMESLANRNSSAAQTVLATMYRDGHGVPQNYGQALLWYEKAAAMGNAAAMDNLGWLYLKGKGVAKDDAKATVWYEKAAAQPERQRQTALEAERQLRAAAAERQRIVSIQLMADKLGLVVEEISTEQSELWQINRGVSVREVFPDPGRNAEFVPGDIITQVNNREVDSLQIYKQVLKTLVADKWVPVLVYRSGKPVFVAVYIPTG